MYRFFYRLSRLMAILGGAVLALLVVLTCVSILGRELNGILHLDALQAAMPGLTDYLLNSLHVGEVKGGYELTESGMAVVIFAFLPFTQITSGHAIVDILTNQFSPRTNRVLIMLAEILFAAVLCVVAFQLYQGMLTKLKNGETTLFLQYPVWWSYAASLVCAVIAAVVAVYVALMRSREVMTGRTFLPDSAGAEH